MNVNHLLAATLALAALFGEAVTAASGAAGQGDYRPAIGHRMPDGTVYADFSPDTGKALYATPADAPGLYDWSKAAEYCTTLETDGHQDWRVPTKGELNVLFQNRAAIGGFNETGSHPAGWYWSSSPVINDGAWAQRFSDGLPVFGTRGGDLSLRCIR